MTPVIPLAPINSAPAASRAVKRRAPYVVDADRMIGRSVNWRTRVVTLPSSGLGDGHGVRRLAAGDTHVQVCVGSGTCCRITGRPEATAVVGVLSGEARWVTPSREFIARSGMCLVIAAGTPWTMHVDSPALVRTVQVSLLDDSTRLRDDWTGARGDSPGASGAEGNVRSCAVYTGLWPADGVMGLAFQRVSNAVASRSALTDALDELAVALVDATTAHLQRADCIPAVRRSTRLEILRRVSAGRDFMESHIGERLTLGRVARAAAMSPFHFHRAFVQIFQQTPHQYVATRRLSIAAALLASSRIPVAQVAYFAGFGSTRAFATAFRRHKRTSPMAFRRAVTAGTDAALERPSLTLHLL